MRSTTQSISRKNSKSKVLVCPRDIPAIPKERLSKKELAEHRRVIARMKQGEEVSHFKIFGE